MHKIAAGLAVATACTPCVCDLHVRAAGKCAKVSRAAHQPPVGPNIQLIYGVIGKNEKGRLMLTPSHRHKMFLWFVTKIQGRIMNSFHVKKRCT